MGITSNDITKARNKLTDAVKKWGLIDDGGTFETHSSLLKPVIYKGKRAMLKVPFSAEERRSCLLMFCYDGNGAAQVWEYDKTALLMDRALGAGSLKQMVAEGNEDEANQIICTVAKKLHAVNCLHIDELIPLQKWFQPLEPAAAKYGGMLVNCHRVAGDLLSTPIDNVILHGDIHYENILDSGIRGWVAIDPKGLTGERGFDFANIFCNPDSKTATSPVRLSRQVKLVAKEAGLDSKRLLNWIIAWAGLSAAFMLEDGEDAHVPLTVAHIAQNELNNF
jgi:streptomycin 6-kinase